MEALQLLSRNEMRKLNAGYMPPGSDTLYCACSNGSWDEYCMSGSGWDVYDTEAFCSFLTGCASFSFVSWGNTSECGG